MATYYGAQKTKVNTGPTGANIVSPGLLGGRVRCMVDTYEAAALAAASVIEMGQELPVGATILEIILHTDNLQNSTTIAVGDYEDADRYLDAVDCGSAEVTKMIGTTTGNIDGRAYTIDETYTGKTVGSGTDRQITLTTGTGEATGTIKLIVLYTID